MDNDTALHYHGNSGIYLRYHGSAIMNNTNNRKLLHEIKKHEKELAHKSVKDFPWWDQFISLHPADMADILSDLDKDTIRLIFTELPLTSQAALFSHFSDKHKVAVLSFLDDTTRSLLLSATPIDELTDLFYGLSDEELKTYLALLSKKDRTQVLSLMRFDPESAGGIMETDVLTLLHEFTVGKSIHVLQRIQPRVKVHRRLYVVDQNNILVGYIKLEDLVLKKPDTRISEIVRYPELIIDAHEDQEKVVQKMRHYDVISAPVVSEKNYFLGEIVSEDLIQIAEQEAREDIQRMASLPTTKYPYFETSFLRMFFERSYILIGLLLAQSISTMIIERYEVLLAGFLTYFITMLTSTGGNSSSQTSAVVIQGMASGEITQKNAYRFLRREFLMALMIAGILGVVSFARVYILHGYILGSLAVSISLSLIVLTSVVLGSCIPLILRKLNLDPAFAAGPFLATLMDIIGLIIYCKISSMILVF